MSVLSHLKLLAATILVFTAINVTSISTALAQSTNTDDEIFNNIGGTIILNQEVNNILYKDENIQSEIMRIGIPNACPSIKQSSPIVLKEYEGAFKILSVKIVRKYFQSRMASGTDPHFFHHHKNSLTQSLKTHHNDFFIEVANKSIAANLQHLKKLPDTQENWRGRYTDWDFTIRPHLPLGSACLIEAQPQPDRKRILFDSLYNRKVVK